MTLGAKKSQLGLFPYSFVSFRRVANRNMMLFE